MGFCWRIIVFASFQVGAINARQNLASLLNELHRIYNPKYPLLRGLRGGRVARAQHATNDAVEDVMPQAHDFGIPLLMSVVNVGEIWYSVARKRSEKHADERIHDIRELG